MSNDTFWQTDKGRAVIMRAEIACKLAGHSPCPCTACIARELEGEQRIDPSPPRSDDDDSGNPGAF